MASKRKVAETLLEHQAARILGAFAEWLRGRPGRKVTLHHDGKRWRVDLDDKQIAHGATLVDASAQLATVMNLDPEGLGR